MKRGEVIADYSMGYGVGKVTLRKGPYQPKTGAKCSCKRGVQRDNCPACEGTGWRIDFRAIRERKFEATSTEDGHGSV